MSDVVKPARHDQALNEKLATSGFRFTPQRQHVYNVLLETRDHPTADQVFMRAKQTMPDISMATVYNCLDALVKSGVVRQVSLDRAATRYCPNMTEHCHFHCTDCGRIFDIDLNDKPTVPEARLPRGFKPDQIEISMRGHCPDKTCPVNHKN
jgi:Fur family transcriptional regulator, peroxide stress response regulator